MPQTDLPLSVGAALAAYDLFEDALETGLETPASFFALMTVWFLILSALLFYLLRAVEHRRSVRWMAAALGFVLLFAALCALYDTDWLDAAPLWLLWTVAALAAAAAAALLLYGAGRDKQRFTRGMIVTILYRLESGPAVSAACPFDDVASGMYYEDAVTWAVGAKMIEGTGTKLEPQGSATRAQAAAILHRFCTNIVK